VFKTDPDFRVELVFGVFPNLGKVHLGPRLDPVRHTVQVLSPLGPFVSLVYFPDRLCDATFRPHAALSALGDGIQLLAGFDLGRVRLPNRV
jgi:hypothetical protein